MIIRPAKNILGALRLPGDKSISHRYAMLAAIAAGTTRLANFSTGADCASTVACVQQLGCAVRKNQDGTLEIDGREQLQAPASSLDCGNSGSTMRMLSGILAGQNFSCDLHGDESLSRRPMGRIMTPLRLMGAEITASRGRSASVAYSRRQVAGDRLHDANCQRAGEIRSAVCRAVCRR